MLCISCTLRLTGNAFERNPIRCKADAPDLLALAAVHARVVDIVHPRFFSAASVAPAACAAFGHDTLLPMLQQVRQNLALFIAHDGANGNRVECGGSTCPQLAITEATAALWTFTGKGCGGRCERSRLVKRI